jgi:PBP1b-binding outer membrane lipoprotein LpoB
MKTDRAGWLFLITIFLTGCSVGKNTYSPTKKFSLQQVKKDYSLYQNILEAHHPSLYWYTSKDSMNYFLGMANRC